MTNYTLHYAIEPDVQLTDDPIEDVIEAVKAAYDLSRQAEGAGVGVVHNGIDPETERPYAVSISYIHAPLFDGDGDPFYKEHELHDTEEVL